MNLAKLAAPHGVYEYLIHVSVGFVILALAIIALSSVKGSFVHRLSGRIFIVLSLVAGVTALRFMNDIGFVPNIFGTSVLALSIVISSFLALRKPNANVKISEALCLLLTFSVVVVLLKRNISFAIADGVLSESFVFTFACASFSLFFLLYDLYFFSLNRQARIKAKLNRHICGMAFVVATMVHAPIVSVFTEANINFYIKFFGPYLIWPFVFYTFSINRTRKATNKIVRPSGLSTSGAGLEQ